MERRLLAAVEAAAGSSTYSIGSESHAKSCSPTRPVCVCYNASLPGRACLSDSCFLNLVSWPVRRGVQACQEERRNLAVRASPLGEQSWGGLVLNSNFVVAVILVKGLAFANA